MLIKIIVTEAAATITVRRRGRERREQTRWAGNNLD